MYYELLKQTGAVLIKLPKTLQMLTQYFASFINDLIFHNHIYSIFIQYSHSFINKFIFQNHYTLLDRQQNHHVHVIHTNQLYPMWPVQK